MSELKPCPFCGAPSRNGTFMHSITCPIHWLVNGESPPDDAWNTRHIPEGYALVPVDQYPMQPIQKDEHGRSRFEANPVIEWLATDRSDMNEIAIYCQVNDIDSKYQEQLAQLIGYSIRGYGELSYVSDDSYDRAEEIKSAQEHNEC